MTSKFLELADLSHEEDDTVAMVLSLNGDFKPVNKENFYEIFSYMPISATPYAAVQVNVKQRAGAHSLFRNEYKIVNDKGKVITSTFKIVKWSADVVAAVPKPEEEVRSLNGSLNGRLDDITARAVRYIELSEKCRVMNMTVEYCIDEDDQPWLTIVPNTVVIYGDLRQSEVGKEADRIKIAKRNHILSLRSEFKDTSNKSNPGLQLQDDEERVQEIVENASFNVEAGAMNGVTSPTAGNKPRYMVADSEERKQFRVSRK
jgi:hypothetical protein